jgi:hypothetical protein
MWFLRILNDGGRTTGSNGEKRKNKKEVDHFVNDTTSFLYRISLIIQLQLRKEL